MIRYFNFKGPYGIETIDQINREDFRSSKDFKMEIFRLVREYNIAGIPVYISQRCDKRWGKAK